MRVAVEPVIKADERRGAMLVERCEPGKKLRELLKSLDPSTRSRLWICKAKELPHSCRKKDSGPNQVSQVRGFADQRLLLRDDPTNAKNRRISQAMRLRPTTMV